ncbi:MAG TPA: hypothetical protein VLA37_11905 [Sphingomonadaceae bacterium]|nr:hypothetical protein [Sphingomonadaceae bacterium]
MKKILTALAISALALTGTAAQAEKKSGEEELAELLDGRVAGEPMRCIPTWRGSESMSIIDNTAIVYRSGKTIYVNRTQQPQNLDWNDVLVINRFSGSELCRLDQVTTIDRGSGFFTGVVFLTDFVPYTLPDKDKG